ncbi:MAG: VCBS repeat-containing protein, partial [Thermodesulfobacteriota bacterium]|nr:VCBS repeat-containing protein [Thermodesulfobacteriota bacterium]
MNTKWIFITMASLSAGVLFLMAFFVLYVPMVNSIEGGLGWFDDQTSRRLPVQSDQSIEADFGDVDNDGDIDIVVANAGKQADVLLINKGGGFFENESHRLLV